MSDGSTIQASPMLESIHMTFVNRAKMDLQFQKMRFSTRVRGSQTIWITDGMKTHSQAHTRSKIKLWISQIIYENIMQTHELINNT